MRESRTRFFEHQRILRQHRVNHRHLAIELGSMHWHIAGAVHDAGFDVRCGVTNKIDRHCASGRLLQKFYCLAQAVGAQAGRRCRIVTEPGRVDRRQRLAPAAVGAGATTEGIAATGATANGDTVACPDRAWRRCAVVPHPLRIRPLFVHPDTSSCGGTATFSCNAHSTGALSRLRAKSTFIEITMQPR